MKVTVFIDNDKEYFKWIDKHPSGFIVNTRRRANSDYYVLHKANCFHISAFSSSVKGAYTERAYIKIGSVDLIKLTNWFKKNNTKFSGDFHECRSCNPRSSGDVLNPMILYPDDISNESVILTEGALMQATVNSYERNSKARKKCIDHYGAKCSVCGLSFENVYGIGKGFIHVHHLKELSEIRKSYIVDPLADLIPVCPNCHAMLHQKTPCYTVEELKNMLKKTK